MLLNCWCSSCAQFLNSVEFLADVLWVKCKLSKNCLNLLMPCVFTASCTETSTDGLSSATKTNLEIPVLNGSLILILNLALLDWPYHCKTQVRLRISIEWLLRVERMLVLRLLASVCSTSNNSSGNKIGGLVPSRLAFIKIITVSTFPILRDWSTSKYILELFWINVFIKHLFMSSWCD